jgi:AraC-like DNA-binding protein
MEPEVSTSVTLAQLRLCAGSLFGKLEYVSALRSGVSWHRGKVLARGSERGETNVAITAVHQSLWTEWVCLSFNQQCMDVESYLRGLPGLPEMWLLTARIAPTILAWAPEQVGEGEQKLALSNLTAIITLLYRVHMKEISNRQLAQLVAPHSTLIAILTVLHTEYTEFDLSLNNTSRMLGMSERQIARLLMSYMSESFTRYIRRLRLNHAKHLLTHSDVSIRGIATIVGYTEVSWFKRYFCDGTGLTPAQFRQSGLATSGVVRKMSDFA